jgi:rSAM/selenodomain-associated transferase 2
MPEISIIMPVLDEAAGIEASLNALQEWRPRGAEVIVVDGGSRDATCRLARPLADQVLRSAPSRARQMNAGVAASHGRLLLFLHADTTLPPAAIPALEALARETVPVWGRFDVRLSGSRIAFRVIEQAMNWRSRVTGIATGDQAIFVHRELFEHAGGYAPLPLMEDIALSTVLRHLAPPRCLRDAVVTSSRRWEQGGVLRTVLLMWWLRARYFFGADPSSLARRYRMVRNNG